MSLSEDSDIDYDYSSDEDNEEDEFNEEDEQLDVFFVQNFQLEPGWVVEHESEKYVVVSINPLQKMTLPDEEDFSYNKTFYGKNNLPLASKDNEFYLTKNVSLNNALQLEDSKLMAVLQPEKLKANISLYIGKTYTPEVTLELLSLEDKSRKTVQVPYCTLSLVPKGKQGSQRSGITKVLYNREETLSSSSDITNIYVKDQIPYVILSWRYKPVVLGDQDFVTVNNLKQSLCNDFMDIWKFVDKLEEKKYILKRLNIYNDVFPVTYYKKQNNVFPLTYDKKQFEQPINLKRYIIDEGTRRKGVVAGKKYKGKSFLDWNKLELSCFNEESIIYKKERLEEYPNESKDGESKDNEDTVADFYKNGSVYHVLFKDNIEKKITFVSQAGQEKTLTLKVDDSDLPVENSVTSEDFANAVFLKKAFPKFCEGVESNCWKLEEDSIPVYYDENSKANEFESWMEIRDFLFDRTDTNEENYNLLAFQWLKENIEEFENYGLNRRFFDESSFTPSTLDTKNNVIAKRDNAEFKTWYDFALDVISNNKFKVVVGGRTLVPNKKVLWSENHNVPKSYEGWTAIVVKDGDNARLKFKKGSSKVDNFDIVVQSILETTDKSNFLSEDDSEIDGELNDDDLINEDSAKEEEEEFKIIIRGDVRKRLKKMGFKGKPETDKFGKWMFSKDEIETLIKSIMVDAKEKEETLKLVKKQFKNNNDLYVRQLDDLDLLHRITLDAKENHPEVYTLIKQGMQYAWPYAKIIYDMRQYFGSKIDPIQQNAFIAYQFLEYKRQKAEGSTGGNPWLSQKVTEIDQSELEDGKLYLQLWDDGWWPVLYNDRTTQARGFEPEKVEKDDKFAKFITYQPGDQIMFSDETYKDKIATILDTTAEGHYSCLLDSNDTDEEYDPNNSSLATSLKGKQTIDYDVEYNNRIMLYNPSFETKTDLSWFDRYVVKSVWRENQFKAVVEKYKDESVLSNIENAQEQLVSHVTAALDFNSQKYQRDLRGRQNRIGLLNVLQEYLAQKTDQLVAMWKDEIETMRTRQYQSFKKVIREYVEHNAEEEKTAKLKSLNKKFLAQDEFNAWMEEYWNMQINIQNTTKDEKKKAKEKLDKWVQQKLFETKSRIALTSEKFQKRQKQQERLKGFNNNLKTSLARRANVKSLVTVEDNKEADVIAAKLEKHSEDKKNALLYPSTKVWRWWEKVDIPFPLLKFYKEERAWYDRCVNASVEVDYLVWRKENESRVKEESNYTDNVLDRWFETTKARMVKKELRKYIEEGGEEVSSSIDQFKVYNLFDGDFKYMNRPFRVLKDTEDEILRYIAEHLNESYRVKGESRLNFTSQEYIDMTKQLLGTQEAPGISSASAPAMEESKEAKKRKAEREIGKKKKRTARLLGNTDTASAASAASAASVASAANQGKREASSAAAGEPSKKKSRKKLYEMLQDIKLRF